MIVAFAFQRQVAQPAIGVHDAARLHGILYKRYQALRGSVRDSPHSNAADARTIFLSRNYNQCFGFGLAPSNALLQAPDVCSSTSTRPVSRSRFGRTMARRNLCSHVQAVL